jgi:CRISPR-associated endonuclease/helicase Cas3
LLLTLYAPRYAHRRRCKSGHRRLAERQGPFFAHSLQGTDKQRWQPLAEHLRAVAEGAGERAAKFGAKNAAALAGLIHDLGKYSPTFQRRLEGASLQVDHSTAGAQLAVQLAAMPDDRLIAQVLAHAVAGHHAGLPNTIGDEGSLVARLKRETDPLDPSWRREIAPIASGLMPSAMSWGDKGSVAYRLGFFGRMVFSCLVDADFRDTEAFYCAAEGRSADRDWPKLPNIVGESIARFDAHMAKVIAAAKATAVNALRLEILSHVRSRAPDSQGLFTLTVPTGGGKTLASLAFALEHAKQHHLERIVYAIPFTSVIDQTVAIFREVLGDEVVLEHHASIDESQISGREAREKLRLAMEDWGAPVIVTTNVQLFESLHSNRPSRWRRLHNLVKSVIVLDEAQTIPLHVLRPCLAVLDELARNYGCTVVLCTATQPAVATPEFEGGLPLGPERELAPEPLRLHQQLKRVRLERLGDRSDDKLVEALARTAQGLVIVNSRAHALTLYRKAVEAGLDGVMHLTTRQYAAHRLRILGDVRQRLGKRKPCRLIATSLVEAGVDLDFPRVWRAEAGLDQIAQAAGRCNREGVRPVEESVVGVFRSTEHKPPREIAQLTGDMARMAGKHADLLSPEAIRAYFGEVYWRKGEALDRERILQAFRMDARQLDFDYRRISEAFRMIESGLAPVIVARETEPREAKAREALASLRAGASAGAVARRVQPFIVQIPAKARDLLLTNGHARTVDGDGGEFVELVTESLYRDEVGLEWENADYLAVEDSII